MGDLVKINKIFLIIIMLFFIILLLIVVAVLKNDNLNLKRGVNELNQENEDVTNELSFVNDKLESTQSKIDETKLILEDFEDSLKDSTEWFKQNSNIVNFEEYNSIRDTLRKRCIDINNNLCNIKLSCFPFVFNNIYKFEYKNDSKITDKEDKLQSLDKFYYNKGGDCEDYSLAVIGSLNYITNYCKEKKENINFKVEAITEGSYNYDIDFVGDWYYENTLKYDIPENYNYYYIVCGNFPSDSVINNYEESNIVGHCAIAFTDTKIYSSNDVYKSLKKSIIIEPQDGSLLYDNSYERNKKIIILNKKEDISNDYYIYFVITEKDFYTFYTYADETAEWVGYENFIDSVEDMKNELNNLK